MNTIIVITNLIKSLQEQGFSFEESLHASSFNENFDYLSGTKKRVAEKLQSFNMNYVSYDNINKEAFVRDFNRFQHSVDDRMLFAWAYKRGILSIVGIIDADDLYDREYKSLFNKLDNGVTDIMRTHVAQLNGQSYGIYGTMLMVFSDSNKARMFNGSIQEYYSSHFVKSSYVSSICINCASEELTQGKAGIFTKWTGGMDVSILKNKIFSR